MKISEQNKSRLYDAIAEPIMKKRIAIQRADGLLHKDYVDKLLCDTTKEVWKEIHKTLNLEGPA